MKSATIRQLQRATGKTLESIQPGETLTVTKRGQVHGHYVRSGRRKRKLPNVLLRLQQHGYSTAEGDRAIQAILKPA
jgi:hypothetical protein